MGRTDPKDPREVFSDLYAFIDTELTPDNWSDLVDRAAGLHPSCKSLEDFLTEDRRPARKKAFIADGERPLAIDEDVPNLEAARALQARLRAEVAALDAGDTHPLNSPVSRLVFDRFRKLKRAVYWSPTYVKEHKVGGIARYEHRGRVYEEKQERICSMPGCGKSFRVRPRDKRKTCPTCTGQRAEDSSATTD